MWIGVGLTFFQQATGQPTVLYYSSKIFSMGTQSIVAAAAFGAAGF